jgi:hypothetical protein
MPFRVAFLKAGLVVASFVTVVAFAASASAQQQPSPASSPPLPAPSASAPEAEPPPPLPPGTTPSSSTAPATTETAAAPPADQGPTSELKPFELDIRGTLNADVLLAYIGLGASADFGLVQAGPGTIAVGASFEHDFCGSVCWFFSAVTPLDFSHRQIWPQARASYHLSLKNAKKLDLYPFVSLGPIFARSEISVDNGAARYVGKDTSIGVNFGAGVNYFVYGHLFIGGEARVRYAAGEYNYKLESGDGTIQYDRGSVDTWSLSGVDVVFTVGVRLP